VCQEYGIENEIIPRIASGFGGGIGNTGAVCGAVVGAVMAFGLIREPADSVEGWMQQAAEIAEFRKKFEEEMGTISCRELTGQDMTTKEGLENLMNSEVAMTVCFPAVTTAYNLMMNMLKED